jgi:predicted RNA-binding Zn ribbon-like protein
MAIWVLPAEPRPVRLMNTIWADRAAVYDDLTSVDALRSWLSDTGTAAPDARQADLTAALSLRGSLRRLAYVVTVDTRPRTLSGLSVEAALATVNEHLALAPPAQLRLTKDAVCYEQSLRPRSARDVLAAVAAEGADLLTANDPCLRACLAPGCVLYFVKDHPRRAWCSPACGNRARAARHYARHRTD